MNARVILRPKVPGDLQSIFDYFASQNPAVADRFVENSKETLEELAEAPGMGSPKEFRSRKFAGIRSWRVRGFDRYVIYYRPVDVGIEVFGILHGARDVRRILGKRL